VSLLGVAALTGEINFVRSFGSFDKDDTVGAVLAVAGFIFSTGLTYGNWSSRLYPTASPMLPLTASADVFVAAHSAANGDLLWVKTFPSLE
jgi:hypothetical protein